MDSAQNSSPVYAGYYGEFTITDNDRREVWIYRTGLAIAAGCFALGSGLVLWQGETQWVQQLITPLYFVFCVALGISLATIHIYLVPLHRLLQGFWLVGFCAAIAISLLSAEPLVATVYHSPATIWGIGFTFAALTGIFFKEGFCFRRLETMILTFLVPTLLLGHLTQSLSLSVGQFGLGLWSILFVVFAARKFTQIPADDIGDKSVFEYMKKAK
ncbi:MAG: DUF2301 domain-containing membrane protein [Limnothrix sp. RL_2_0]|nr:DUF2301 domain-containing membrane protein [Limnothrix sp. RL_2_0]